MEFSNSFLKIVELSGNSQNMEPKRTKKNNRRGTIVFKRPMQSHHKKTQSRNMLFITAGFEMERDLAYKCKWSSAVDCSLFTKNVFTL